MCTHQFTNLSCWWGTSRWGTSANSIKSLDSKIKTKVNMSTTPKERTKKNDLKRRKKSSPTLILKSYKTEQRIILRGRWCDIVTQTWQEVKRPAFRGQGKNLHPEISWFSAKQNSSQNSTGNEGKQITRTILWIHERMTVHGRTTVLIPSYFLYIFQVCILIIYIPVPMNYLFIQFFFLKLQLTNYMDLYVTGFLSRKINF